MCTQRAVNTQTHQSARVRTQEDIDHTVGVEREEPLSAISTPQGSVAGAAPSALADTAAGGQESQVGLELDSWGGAASIDCQASRFF